ncbi:hypothetical protein MKX01_013250 [Papaver californicum]|nr:hypothetical protein MKX01_013250 [Papaver californicum]
MGMQTDKVRFNVGGKIFETTATFLASASRRSMLRASRKCTQNLHLMQSTLSIEHHNVFMFLLIFYRTCELYVPPHISDKLLYREALYYGLIYHVKTARFSEFDCNRLSLTSSDKGQASGSFITIGASPDGGCDVAHDRIVQDSGIGLFSSSKGDLKHIFQLNHEDQVKSFIVFDACSGTGIHGIGVWDQVTENKTDFFDKIINAYINLLDLRDKSMVWYANDIPVNKYGPPLRPFDSSMFYDVQDEITMEGSNSIRVVDKYENLCFMDIRSTGSIRWNNSERKPCKKVESSYPKLTLHGGQFFSCRHDRISMFYGPEILFLSTVFFFQFF